MATAVWAIALIVFCGIVGALGPIYLKKASAKLTLKNIINSYKNKYLIFAILLYLIPSIIALPALKAGELSVIYPLIGLSYVWTSLYSVWLLKESMTWQKWLGMFMIVVGVAFIGAGAI